MNSLLAPIAVSALATLAALMPRTANAQYAATVLADKPVAYYRLDESAGATIVANSAPTGPLFDGVIHSGAGRAIQFRAPGALTVSDPTNTAFGFGGDIVTIPRMVQDDFTIEFFFRTTALGPDTGLKNFYDGSGLVNGDAPGARDDFGTCFAGGRVLFGVGRVSGDRDLTIRTPGGLNDGKWHLVDAVRTRSTGSIELFIDGKSITSATGGTQSLDSSPDLQIGKVASDYGPIPSHSNAFDGSIDEVAIYPTALSADRIAKHYLAATTPAPANSPSSTAGDAGAYNGEPGSLKVALAHRLSGHSEYVNSVAFSPDGKTVASGARDHSVRLWDVETGTQKSILGKHENFVSCVAFSPDGKTVVSGGWDNKIRQFDIATNTEISGGKFDKHQNYVLSLTFNPNGQRLASGSNDKTARTFAVATGASSATTTLPDAIASVAFSPSGTRLAGACLDGSVYVWDAETLKLLYHLVPNGAASPQFSVVFFDNDTLAVGGKDGMVRVWTLHNENVQAALTTGGREIYGVAYDPNRHLLAAGGADRLIHFWAYHNIKAAKGGGNVATAAIAPGHRDTVRALAFSPDGDLLASGSWDFDIDLWHLSNHTAQDRLILDPLNDFTKTYRHSAGWTLDTANPELFGNDGSRLHRTGDTSENLIYRVLDMKAFTARIYLQGDTNGGVTDIAGKVNVYSSPDNTAYTPVTFTHDAPVSSSLRSDWSLTNIQADLPAGTNYLKIEFAHDPKGTSPQLSEVRIAAGGN